MVSSHLHISSPVFLYIYSLTSCSSFSSSVMLPLHIFPRHPCFNLINVEVGLEIFEILYAFLHIILLNFLPQIGCRNFLLLALTLSRTQVVYALVPISAVEQSVPYKQRSKNLYYKQVKYTTYKFTMNT